MYSMYRLLKNMYYMHMYVYVYASIYTCMYMYTYMYMYRLLKNMTLEENPVMKLRPELAAFGHDTPALIGFFRQVCNEEWQKKK